MVDGSLDPCEGAEHVDIEDLASGVEVEVDERTVDGVDADVGDEHVETAELLGDRVEDLRSVRRVVGFAGDADRGAFRELRDRLLQRLGLAGGEDDRGAFVVETLRDAQPDSAAGSGDEGDLSLEAAARAGRGFGAI